MQENAVVAPRASSWNDFCRQVLEIIAGLSPCSEYQLLASAADRGLDLLAVGSLGGLTGLLRRCVIELQRRGLLEKTHEEQLVISDAGRSYLKTLEPTMEEILASIRRIISEDEPSSARQPTASASQQDEEGLELAEGEADDKIINDIARVLSGAAPAVEEEDILDLTAELGGLEPVEELEAVELVAEAEVPAPAPVEQPARPKPVEASPPPASQASAPQAKPAEKAPEAKVEAPPQPMSASEEAASALERAIAALRAGHVPTSSPQSESQFMPTFAFAPEPEPEPEPQPGPEPELVLTEFEFEVVTEGPVALEALVSEPEEVQAWESEAPSFEAPEEPEIEPAPQAPRTNRSGAHPAYNAAAPSAGAMAFGASSKTLEDSVKDMLRPMLRQWLDENMARVLAGHLPELPNAGVIGESTPTAMRGSKSKVNLQRANSGRVRKASGQLAETPPTAPDLVDASVFASKTLPAGAQGLVQVFLHKPNQREIVREIAGEADPDTCRRGVRTLVSEIARGKAVEVILEGNGLEVDEELQTLIWRGDPCACQFMVTVPAGTGGKVFHPVVLILLDSVPIGSLKFTVCATCDDRTPAPEIHDQRFRRYRHAFLSYALPDRAAVLRGAQLLQNLGISFFNDVLSLEPGDRWAQRLFQEIDRCDIFLLFWSSHAKASEWVRREIDHALVRQAASKEELPDIRPIVLEGPPPPEPPDELKHLHFNDRLMYVLAASRSQIEGTPSTP